MRRMSSLTGGIIFFKPTLEEFPKVADYEWMEQVSSFFVCFRKSCVSTQTPKQSNCEWHMQMDAVSEPFHTNVRFQFWNRIYKKSIRLTFHSHYRNLFFPLEIDIERRNDIFFSLFRRKQKDEVALIHLISVQYLFTFNFTIPSEEAAPFQYKIPQPPNPRCRLVSVRES